MKSIDFRTNWISDFLPIGSLWLETSATALRGPYVSYQQYIAGGRKAEFPKKPIGYEGSLGFMDDKALTKWLTEQQAEELTNWLL